MYLQAQIKEITILSSKILSIGLLKRYVQKVKTVSSLYSYITSNIFHRIIIELQNYSDSWMELLLVIAPEIIILKKNY